MPRRVHTAVAAGEGAKGLRGQPSHEMHARLALLVPRLQVAPVGLPGGHHVAAGTAPLPAADPATDIPDRLRLQGGGGHVLGARRDSRDVIAELTLDRDEVQRICRILREGSRGSRLLVYLLGMGAKALWRFYPFKSMLNSYKRLR